MDKKFLPTLEINGQHVLIKDIYEKFYYSKALSDLLELVSSQYDRLKGE